ncbi:MAG: cysteine desulfurase [Cyclobacteriaceae bacterium]
MNLLHNDFPILSRKNREGKSLVYLDNAATTQKPIQVIEAVSNFYKNHNANIHRGIHFLGVEATSIYEDCREKVRRFINAESSDEIIFVRGTSEAVNLVSGTFGEQIGEGDEILITAMEHHSNLVPWQQLAFQKKAKLKVIPLNKKCDLDLNKFKKLLTPKVKLLALCHISNSIGTVNPVKNIVELAHENKTVVLVDGAQAMAHQSVDVQDLDCDFYAFSGHKMFAPTGIGVLYGKRSILKNIPPYHYGGEMIKKVTFNKTSFAELPHKFEAGTPDIGGAVGLAAAIDYINEIGVDKINAHTSELTEKALNELSEVEGIKVVGAPKERAAIVSFIVEGIHPHDMATLLDEDGVAVRAGHHCTMPLMESLGLQGTVRASFSIYNTLNDVNRLVQSVKRAQHKLS